MSVARIELNTLLPLYCSLSSRHRLFFLKAARGEHAKARGGALSFPPLARSSSNFLFSPPKNTGACYAGYCVAPRKGIQDSLGSGFHAMDSGLFVSGTWIPDFRQLHSGSHTKNLPHSAFHKKEFPGFRDPDSLTAEAICNYF